MPPVFRRIPVALLLPLLLVGTAPAAVTVAPSDAPPEASGATARDPREPYAALRGRLAERYGNRRPAAWSETAPGVRTRLDGSTRAVALTFDLCGKSLDRELLAWLEAEGLPATIFVSGPWIGLHPEELRRLAASPLFEIGNHGLRHLPCSVSGREAWGIRGTLDAGEAVDEMELNARRLEEITGRRPRLYRPGTAFTDEVCPLIAAELGMEVAGFSVLGDAGGTWPAERVAEALRSAGPGDIVLLHLNRPGSGTLEGLRRALPALRERGLRFVRLGETRLRSAGGRTVENRPGW